MIRHKHVLFAASLLVVWQLPALAHDNWFEAEPFFSPTPHPVKIYFFRGEHFTEAEQRGVRSRERYSRFEAVRASGRRDLRAEVHEDQLVLTTLPGGAGTTLLAADAAPIAIEIGARKFNDYLLEERLIDVLAGRAERGAEDAVGRERYSRCMKVLVQQGSTKDDFVTRPIGQEIEIVPAVNPYSLAPGDSLTVQVLFHGQPLARRAVTAANRYRSDVITETLRTDAEGRVRFKIGRKGDWMVRLVHMEPGKEPGVDWRSYWSSMTFSLGD